MSLRMILFRILGTSGILVLLPFCIAQDRLARWPDITPVRGSIYFPESSKAGTEIDILNSEGKTLYILSCHNGDYENQDFNYSGDLHCRLTPTYSQIVYSTLLTETPNQTNDWDNRGRFLANELIGICGDYPEYGRVRHFRLRGMKVTLNLSELAFELYETPSVSNANRLESFRLAFEVESDPTAVSEIAEQVPFERPPLAHPEDPSNRLLNCKDVIRSTAVED